MVLNKKLCQLPQPFHPDCTYLVFIIVDDSVTLIIVDHTVHIKESYST